MAQLWRNGLLHTGTIKTSPYLFHFCLCWKSSNYKYSVTLSHWNMLSSTMVKHSKNSIILMLYSVLDPGRDSCQGMDYARVTSSSGLLASVVTMESGCGSAETPWLLSVPKGQRINLTLYDFGRAPSSLNDTTVNTDYIWKNNCRLVHPHAHLDGPYLIIVRPPAGTVLIASWTYMSSAFLRCNDNTSSLIRRHLWCRKRFILRYQVHSMAVESLSSIQ